MSAAPAPPNLGRQRGGIIFKLVALLLLLALLAGLYLFRRPILRAAGGFWVAAEDPTDADVIVVLSDDNFQAERAARAAELYHNRWAPLVAASGRRLRPYSGIAELMERDLTDRGVPREAVVRLAHQAANTYEEAQQLRRVARERGWRRVMVVTSNYHTRRARYIFGKVMPPDAVVRVVAAHDSAYNPREWWHTRQGVKIFFHETVGYAVALWEVNRE